MQIQAAWQNFEISIQIFFVGFCYALVLSEIEDLMHAASEYTGEVRIVLLHPRLNFQSHFEMQRQIELWGDSTRKKVV